MKRFDSDDPAEPLRLAFSQLEKAKNLSDESTRARTAGRIDEARYRSLQDFYARHMQRAQEKITHLREGHRRRAEALRKDLQEAGRQQLELSERVSAHEVGARRANRLNHDLAIRLNELRAHFNQEDRLASAEDSATLGGPIDLPLDQYVQATQRPNVPAVSTGRLAGTLLPVLVCLSVFLPWLVVGGTARPLASLSTLPALHNLGLHRVVLVGLLALYVVWPLVGAIFTWLEARRLGGWGLVVVGAGAAVMAPLAIAGVAYGLGGHIYPVDLIRNLGSGFFVYCIGGLLMVYVGARRLHAPGVSWSASRSLGLLAAAAAIAVAAAFIFLSLRPAGPAPQFQSTPPDPATGLTRVICTNLSPAQIQLYVPWPEGNPGGPLVEDRRRAYGALVYVRERGAKTFRVLPDSRSCWKLEGPPIPANAPVLVEPDERIVLDFNPRAIAQAVTEPQAVRIDFTNASGRVVASYPLKVLAINTPKQAPKNSHAK